jgi:hypothetical protein
MAGWFCAPTDLYPGRLGTMTHDYKRNGTTTLFAALNVAEGIVIEACIARHRHQEWLKFLKIIDGSTDPTSQLHLVADNYATHKHPKVRRWLARHPRFHMHFTPTSNSRLNLVERLVSRPHAKTFESRRFHQRASTASRDLRVCRST